jgi:molybdopterin converting factor subunit 1
MVVRIRLFALLRERAGTNELALELPDGARVRDALADPALTSLAGGLPLVMAVNREYASEDAPLAPGDELALIPPVSGGAEPHVALRDGPLSLDALIARVRDPRAGAVVTFSGVTREVPSLEYEAYAEMALEQLRAVVAEAIERHGLCAAAAEHRVGTVPLSEASVIVAVSAPHRAEAFAGGREIIDRLKALAPIWKREVGEDGGATWVAGAAPSAAGEAPPAGAADQALAQRLDQQRLDGLL